MSSVQQRSDEDTGAVASALPLKTGLRIGALGALVASACCIPPAAAVALGLSLGTAAALAELLTYRPLFVAAGIGLGAALLWLAVRRQRGACPVDEPRKLWDRALTPTLVAFAAVYVFVNQLVVPFLYDLRWLIR